MYTSVRTTKFNMHEVSVVINRPELMKVPHARVIDKMVIISVSYTQDVYKRQSMRHLRIILYEF